MMPEQIAIEPPETELTREEIIEDVAGRLVMELAKSCYLTRLCAYRGYCAKLTAELQLADFDTTTVTAGITVGNFDPAQPSLAVTVDVPLASAAEVRERNGFDSPANLERSVDGNTPVRPLKKRNSTTRCASKNVMKTSRDASIQGRLAHLLPPELHGGVVTGYTDLLYPSVELWGSAWPRTLNAARLFIVRPPSFWVI